MSNSRFIFSFIVLLAIQLVLTKYCQIGPFIYISLLPAMILCMPTSRPVWYMLAVAFISGLLVDGLADGPLGLNAAALLFAAVLQRPVIRIVIDEELVERHYNFSFHSNGYVKILLALAIVAAVYLTAYVILDSAGTRSFWFNALKVLISMPLCILFGIPVISTLSPYQRR